MNRQKKQYRREDLEKLTSPQLDAILCAELEKECADRNMILGILEILDEREKDAPLPKSLKVTEEKIRCEAWNEGFNKGKKAGRKPMRKLASVAIAAMLILVFGVITPQALGAENIFTLIGMWTADFFAFDKPETMPEGEMLQEPYAFRTDNPGLQQLYDTVTELGINKRVVPQWLPEGYELVELKVDGTERREKICACFSNGSQEMIISIRQLLQTPDFNYFKDETDVEIHECDGVLHYIIENEELTKAVWNVADMECYIRTEGEDYLHQIIDSIYSGV